MDRGNVFPEVCFHPKVNNCQLSLFLQVSVIFDLNLSITWPKNLMNSVTTSKATVIKENAVTEVRQIVFFEEVERCVVRKC